MSHKFIPSTLITLSVFTFLLPINISAETILEQEGNLVQKYLINPLSNLFLPLFEPEEVEVETATVNNWLSTVSETPVANSATRTETSDLASLKAELKVELENFIRLQLNSLASPATIYQPSPSVTTGQLEAFKNNELTPAIQAAITRQSDSDVSRVSSSISRITNGGVLNNPTITGGTITGATFSGTISGTLSGSFSSPIESTVTTGTAPFSILSTTVVPNLNASLLEGNAASAFATAAQGALADTATQPADIADFQTEAEVDARVEVVAGDSLNGRTIRQTIADDNVWIIPLGFAVGAGNVTVTTGSSGTGDAGGVFAIRTSGGIPLCTIIAASSSYNCATGVLSGTAGVDGKMTVSVYTDNNLYIENRRGYANGFSVTINAAP